jgi:hypothetical protein
MSHGLITNGAVVWRLQGFKVLFILLLYVLTVKEVYIIKSAAEYLIENLYQANKIFVDCFELHSDFAALSTEIKRNKWQVKI